MKLLILRAIIYFGNYRVLPSGKDLMSTCHCRREKTTSGASHHRGTDLDTAYWLWWKRQVRACFTSDSIPLKFWGISTSAPLGASWWGAFTVWYGNRTKEYYNAKNGSSNVQWVAVALPCLKVIYTRCCKKIRLGESFRMSITQITSSGRRLKPSLSSSTKTQMSRIINITISTFLSTNILHHQSVFLNVDWWLTYWSDPNFFFQRNDLCWKNLYVCVIVSSKLNN